MVTHKKIIEYFAAFIFVFVVLSPLLLASQNSKYIGNENNIQNAELSNKSKSTNFNDKYSAQIYEDSKNTYFAIDIAKLNSKYLEFRILELCYGDKAIVSIGKDNTNEYYFFLVNNTLNKSAEEINQTFDDFLITATNELSKLNEEQIRLWLIQHDKSKK